MLATVFGGKFQAESGFGCRGLGQEGSLCNVASFVQIRCANR